MEKCNCTANFSITGLCTPPDPTWRTCPEKTRYVAFMLTNSQSNDFGIDIDNRYFSSFEVKYLVQSQKTIEDVMEKFNLTRKEFNELIGEMVYDEVNN